MKKEIKELKDIIVSLPSVKEAEGEEYCYELLTNKLKELTAFRTIATPGKDKLLMQEFRWELLDLIHSSYFCKYVYDKPRGYSGDFRTQEMIWLGLTSCDENRYLGETELGKLLSSLTFEMENPQANVARVKYLKDQVYKSGTRIASLGCGPCLELWELDDEEIHDKTFFLLDQDDGALKRAIDKMTISTDKVICVRDNIIRFILKNKRDKLLGPRDLINLFGLLDYFPVKSSQRIINSLWGSVAPGGSIIVTNASPENPTRLWMEYVGDWFLSYKTKEDMYSLTHNLNEIDTVEYILDDFHVYQYLKIVKKK